MGLIAINRRQEQVGRVYNLGYVFHPSYHGQGYATEGCRAAMDYVFEQLAAHGILTGTHPANQPSVRLLERLGIKEIDQVKYAMSREDWLVLDR